MAAIILPSELISMIARLLHTGDDLLHFALICKRHHNNTIAAAKHNNNNSSNNNSKEAAVLVSLHVKGLINIIENPPLRTIATEHQYLPSQIEHGTSKQWILPHSTLTHLHSICALKTVKQVAHTKYAVNDHKYQEALQRIQQQGRLNSTTQYYFGKKHGIARSYGFAWLSSPTTGANQGVFLEREKPYQNGQKEGQQIRWNKAGVVIERTDYKAGRKHGYQQIFHNSSGRLVIKIRYKEGEQQEKEDFLPVPESGHGSQLVVCWQRISTSHKQAERWDFHTGIRIYSRIKAADGQVSKRRWDANTAEPVTI